MKKPRVVSFSTVDTNGQAVRFTVSTDIVDYMESSRTFGREDLADPQAHGRYQRRVIAIPDRKTTVVTPMVLTIGNLNGLSLVRRDESSSSGWKLIDLGRAFTGKAGPQPQVRAVGAAWSDDDRITVAVAVDDGPGQAGSRVYVAYDLTSRNTDWENLQWTDCGTRENIRVEGIRVLDGGDKTWTIVLAGDRGPADQVYLLRSDLNRTFSQALVFNPAVTLQEIRDFEAGVHPTFGSGLHVLGMSGGTGVLSFRPFPEYDSTGRPITIPPVVALPCPSGANVLESGLTQGSGSDLYIAGQGIHLISAAELDNDESANVIQIAGPDQASDVQDLVAADGPDTSASVWALLQNGDLIVARRPAGDQWKPTLRLRSGVQEIAPVHGDSHSITSLIVVYTDSRASFLWQDATKVLWQEAAIMVADPNQVAAVSCYGTSLRILDAAGSPQPGVKVRVSASVLSSSALNGNAVFMGPAVSAEVQSDANGSVSIFDRVRSLTPPIYRIAVDGITGSIDINPAAGIHETFKSITGDDLRTMTVPSAKGETPLLSQSQSANRGQVDAVAAGLNQAGAVATSTNGVLPGVRQVGAGDPFSSALRSDAVPDGHRWGIIANSSGVNEISGDTLDQLLSGAETPAQFLANVGETVSEFFEGIGNRIKEGLSIAFSKVKGAYEFVVSVANKVKRFAVKSLEELGSFFSWLWEQVEAGLDRLKNALKLAADWQNILIVRDAMVQAADESLQYLKDSIGGLKNHVNGGFDQILAQIDAWRKEIGVPPARPRRAPSGHSIFDDIKKAAQPVQDLMDEVTGNSVVAWVTHKMESFASELVEFKGPNPLKEALDASEEFVTGVISDQLNNLVSAWDQIQADASRLMDGKLPSFSELNFDTIKDLFVTIGGDALEALLNGLRDLILRSMDLAENLIGVLRDALFVEIRFPFIEQLVELVAPGISVNTSFRLIDGLMLLCAVPATIGYELFFGEAPLKKGEVISLSFGKVTAQAGSDAARRASWIMGMISAGLKLVTVSVQSMMVALAKGGPIGTAPMWLAAAVGTVALIPEIMGLQSHTGTTVDKLQRTMLLISVLIVAKTAALALNADKIKDAPKVNAGMDLFLHLGHFALKSTALEFILDAHSKQRPTVDKREIGLDLLAWVEEFADRAGSVSVALAVMEDDPRAKAALLAGAVALKVEAGGLDFLRAGIAGQLGVVVPA